MRKHWWKLLGVLLVVYALVAGLLVPLKPNLLSVSPGAGELGSRQTFELLGYNTEFLQDAGKSRAWLNYGEGMALEAVEFSATTDRVAQATFELPAGLPTAADTSVELSLIVTGPENGTFVAPRSVVLRQPANPDPARARAAWSRTTIEAGDLAANTAMTFPYRSLLGETIRNLYFHVSLWFAMLILFVAAVVYAIKYLRRKAALDADKLVEVTGLQGVSSLERLDYWSVALTGVGTLFGILGLLTGSIWAKYTWGSFWNWDIKQFTTLIALLIYAGYFVLRASFPDPEQRARLGAVYNIFAFACLIPLIYILPRLSTTSLHPGAEGNPGFGGEDLDNTMRLVFYPIIIGWILFGAWMASLAQRAQVVKELLLRREESAI